MELSKVLAGVRLLQVRGEAPRAVTGVSCDSRTVKKGDLFFALPGNRVDGAQYAADALKRGAAGVVTESPLKKIPGDAYAARVASAFDALGKAAASFYRHPSRRLAMVGITGTNGKTTTSYFLEAILRSNGRGTGVVGTVNYRLDGKVLSDAPNTTPISSDLQKLLAAFVEKGASSAVLEVSSHALALGRVADLEFDGAIFTNLYRDHLDFHKTRAAYFNAKAKLFKMIDDSGKKKRFVVLNADDPMSKKLLARKKGVAVKTFGIKSPADHRAEDVKATLDGTTFAWAYKGKRKNVRLALVGLHNVYNALAAGAAALELGLKWDDVVRGIEALKGVPGRLETVPNERGVHVLVDYAHTDSALELILQQINVLPHKRIFTVFGCGGDRDRTKRGPMGVAASRWSDLAFVTSDNPRTEDPKRIINDVVDGIKAAGISNYKVIGDRRQAIHEAVNLAGRGDTVLIAGKGHETYQILKDKTIHFDDREVAREALDVRKPAVWT